MNQYAVRSGDETRRSATSPMFLPVVSNNCRFLNHHSMASGGGGGAVVCPKPRRVSLLNSSVNDPARSHLRRHLSHQGEMRDSKAGAEILDLILTKGGGGETGIQRFSTYNINKTQTTASSPPFFSGSPPSRVSNPLIQDARFLEAPAAAAAMTTTATTPWSPTTAGSSPGGARKGGGCVRSNFGNSPAVRIEGFNCLDSRRDRNRNCSIPALA